ncbi:MULTISPECIES: hypothetical protein [Calothrix]|uniref:Uncharacterized protein n=2 Tax=Calothrix TaxID=1186 RepID=A0ABR8A9C2_9CYAN|nr:MULTISPECIES: hypothetical protein [Calothrix]MBD2196439.1 hypothetical protein [Calothrix parietina FACHB-288]MBD2224666.1 hypothetical protein [Calothrix anomala FACHB-343]
MIKPIEKKQLDNIATWMVPTVETKLPTILQGVFFMDGNPLPDDCITFYNLEWDTQDLSLLLPVFAPLQWTFHNSFAGWLLLIGAQISRFTYKVQFEDETLQRSQIIAFAFGIPIPKWILDFTMIQDENSPNGDIWYRKNTFFGRFSGMGNYTLRKVVDAEGKYTPAFSDMLSKVNNECLVIVNYS